MASFAELEKRRESMSSPGTPTTQTPHSVPSALARRTGSTGLKRDHLIWPNKYSVEELTKHQERTSLPCSKFKHISFSVTYCSFSSHLHFTHQRNTLLDTIFANRHSSFTFCDRGRNSSNVVILTNEYEILIESLVQEVEARLKREGSVAQNTWAGGEILWKALWWWSFVKTLAGSPESSCLLGITKNTFTVYYHGYACTDAQPLEQNLYPVEFHLLGFVTVIQEETVEWAVQETNPSSRKLGDDRFLSLYLELLTGLDLSWSDKPPSEKNGA